MTNKAEPKKASRGGAVVVGAGILLSRLIGLIRERVFAHYFGNGDAADVFRAALRIPNLLQNLFGEGALSASFIPVYAGLNSRDPKEAARIAGIIFTLLALLTSILVLLGVLFTPFLIDAIAPGFQGEKRLAAIHLVRILFPGVGLLVLSAFCLGVLNSHRRFFIPYAAPVLWSGAMIVTLFFWQDQDAYEFAENLAWGAVIGSFLQLAIQIPSMWPYMRGMRPGLNIQSAPVRSILSRFFPTLLSRGVVQINVFFESMIASFLPTGAVSTLGYAQLIYTLPTSLFGSSIAASQLIDMSVAEQKHAIEKNLQLGLRHLAFFIVPSSLAFVFLGHVLATVLFQTGKFLKDDTHFVWILLAASAVGLMASTQGRLLATAFYALKDTRTPLRCSSIRVVVSIVFALILALILPKIFAVPFTWATAGIPLASSIAALVEYTLLRSALRKELQWQKVSGTYLGKLLVSGVIGGLCGALVFHNLQFLHWPGWMTGIIALTLFGVLYLGLGLLFGIEESQQFLHKVKRRISRKQ